MKLSTLIAMVLIVVSSKADGPICQNFSVSSYGSEPIYKNALRHCEPGPVCSAQPLPGEIKVLLAKYGKVEGCNFWKAKNPTEAQEIVDDFDAWESYPPDVVYKSFGKYPIYTQKVIQGGCPPGRRQPNCAD